MKLLLLTVLLPATAFPLCLHGQNTGARATPQTQNSAPAGVSGAGPAQGTQSQQGTQPQGTQRRSRRVSRAGAPSSRANAERSGSQNRPTTAAPAANSSVTVIGGSKLNPAGATAASVGLPDVHTLHNALGIPSGTPIYVRVQHTITSGQAKNGDTVPAVLAQSLGDLPSGTPVTLTVVAAAPAGEVGSSGVLSLQIISINGEQVLSQVITAEGKKGQTLLPDDAPARGTEAVFTPDQPITIPAA